MKLISLSIIYFLLLWHRHLNRIISGTCTPFIHLIINRVHRKMYFLLLYLGCLPCSFKSRTRDKSTTTRCAELQTEQFIISKISLFLWYSCSRLLKTDSNKTHKHWKHNKMWNTSKAEGECWGIWRLQNSGFKRTKSSSVQWRKYGQKGRWVDLNSCMKQFQCINTWVAITTNKQTCLSLTRQKNLAGPLALTH